MDLTIDQALLQAIEAHKSGQLQDAERLYRSILEVQPKHADANHNLGVLAVGVGKPEAALPFLKAALDVSPEQGQYRISYIDALIRANQFENARSVLLQGQGIGLKGEEFDRLAEKLSSDASPAKAEADALVSAFNQGNYSQAHQLALAMTHAFPAHPMGWKVLGAVLKKAGSNEQSLAPMQRSIELAPNDAEAHSNLGATFQALGRLLEAQACFLRAIELKPDSANAYSNLGNTLRTLGRLPEAEASCRQAIALKSDHAEAHGNLGAILSELGRFSEAQASCRQTIALNPNYAEAHANLGGALQELGHFSEAEASCRQAIALKPDLIEARLNLGNALKELGRFSEATASYRRALALKPDYAEAHSNLLLSMHYASELPAALGLDEAIKYAANVSRRVTKKFTSWRCPQKADKLRVGFVSGDLRNHPVGYFLEGLLSNIDQTKFELIAYVTNPNTDELTERIKPCFKLWQPLFGNSDEAAAKMIHDDGIQILIDLAGHTAHNRLPVFAYKPAPVQVSWLGYFATTGLAEMDYLLGDPHVTPASEEQHFSERIWRLPETYFCFTPPSLDIKVGDLPALSNGYVTFGCFNNLLKMSDRTVALWAKVLNCVEGSKLFLKAKQFADRQIVSRTIERFDAMNISANRLILEGASSRTDYFKSYNRVDIALDPFPFPGGTTTVEGLWMGVPVIAKRGDRFIAHNGETIANNTGQSGWVAEDEDDYVFKAKSFASDVKSLSKMRMGLREQIRRSPLFDSVRFTRHFEAAMSGMWIEHEVQNRLRASNESFNPKNL